MQNQCNKTLCCITNYGSMKQIFKVWFGMECQNILQNWFGKDFNKFCRIVWNQNSIVPWVESDISQLLN